MRKIFFTLFALSVVVPSIASAAKNDFLKTHTPNDRCYGLLRDQYSADKTNVDGGYSEDCTVRIFFLNDKSDIYSGAAGCIDNLKQILQNEIAAASGKQIYLLGMTDSLAKEQHNINLATARVQTVAELMDSLPGADAVNFSYYVSGRSQAIAFHDGNGSNSQPVMRSVCVLVNKDGQQPIIPPVYEPQPVQIDVSHTSVTVANAQINLNGKAQEDAEVTAARNRVNDVVAKISALSNDAGRSVWKNKEGGFNTNRLISDSVAGVVLGTAGGLITSHVVKKNQVRSGLEGVHCSIGGQIVADHSDDFVVGIN